MPDRVLLERIAGADALAFEELWRRYGGPAFRACLRVTRERALAEEATQEAFLRIWRSASLFDRRRGDAAGWIHTIARNAALNIIRSRRPAERLSEEVAAVGGDPSLADRFWVEAALARIPQDERNLIDLAFRQGLSHAEIAEREGMALGTVKTRIRRGVTRLAEMMEPG